MGKLELDRILEEKSPSPKKSFRKYYIGIGAAFAAGNIMAYFADGTQGLYDAISVDLITMGFTIYEQLKLKQANNKLEIYLKELDRLEEKEKLGLISVGDKKATESKAKKIGFIAYELLKKDIGEQPEIEEAVGISSDIIDTLENKGYLKRGILGTKLTRTGKIMYTIILDKMKEEKKEVLLMLNKLYKVPEEELLPMYQLYIETLSEDKSKNKT